MKQRKRWQNESVILLGLVSACAFILDICQGEEPDEANALVMIPRVPIKLPDNNDQETRTQAATAVYEVEETDGSADLDLPTLDMSVAIPPKKNTKRAQVKTRDWRSSIQAYNEL